MKKWILGLVLAGLAITSAAPIMAQEAKEPKIVKIVPVEPKPVEVKPNKPDDDFEPDPNALTFKLGAVETKYLPPQMYGTWSIKATIVQTNAPPWLYTPSSTELWTLGQDNDTIFLKNILTQAEATITVDKVDGNTATFHHLARIPSRDMKILEVPTVTVDGDRLYGVNRQKIAVYTSKGKKKATYDLDIQVEGTRLSGAQVTFGARPRQLDIEIAPIEVQK